MEVTKMAIFRIVGLTLIILGLCTLKPSISEAAGVHAIVDLPGGCLLGGAAQGRWLKPRATAALLRGGEKYRLYSLTRYVGPGKGSKAASAGEPCPDTLEVKIAPHPRGETRIIAVGGPWNALPRVPKLTSTGQKTYRAVTAAILKRKGISNPKVKLTQVIRIDLEGDGVEEVLVAATYVREKNRIQSHAGDYSLVYLRRLVKGRVETTILQGNFYTRGRDSGIPYWHQVAAVLDLNGDGIMEILLFSQYYEGQETTAYQVKGKRVVKILSCGCGS